MKKLCELSHRRWSWQMISDKRMEDLYLIRKSRQGITQ